MERIIWIKIEGNYMDIDQIMTVSRVSFSSSCRERCGGEAVEGNERAMERANEQAREGERERRREKEEVGRIERDRASWYIL
jgi:hypothetical protein